MTPVSQSVTPAITKYCQLGDLKNRNLCPRRPRGWKAKIRLLAELAPGEASLLGLQMAAFLLCPRLAFSLCVHTPAVSSSSNEDTSSVGLEPHSYDFT